VRIDRLDLKRFGCFTDCTLDLSGPGTHLVVGLNEAGKTTGMTAIRQLLFGIPIHSPHAFLHDMRDLCLGAVLRDDAGEMLEITRLKRQADTLRGSQGEILDEAVLARFLHDVDGAVYASLFTIGHDEIARGGEALLVSDGELGRALFSASRGTTDLNAVLRKLDERAAALFKNAASIPKLNGAIRDYKAEAARAKKLSTNASEVARLDDELRAAQDNYDRTAADRKERAQRRTQLERIRAARPQLAARRDCLSEKGRLELVGPLVDPAIRDRLEEAQAQANNSDSQRRAAQAAIDRLDRKLNELSIDSTLLGQRDVIDHLQAGSGGYRQNVEDLPGLVARAGTLERDLEELRRRLPDGCPLDPDGLSGLPVDQEERIRQLAEARPKLEAQLEHASEQVTETTSSLDGLRAELRALDAPADVKALVEVATRVRKAGDLEATRTDTARRLQTVDASLANAMGTLKLDGVDPRALDSVAVPAVETIRQLHAEFDKLTSTVAQLEDQVANLDSQRSRTATELAELLTAERPPREDDLVDARVRRDEGWQLVRGVWIDGSADREAVDTWSNGLSLENAYEAAVGGADEVADRLRAEANAVERRMSLERQLEEIDGRLVAGRQELDVAQADRDDDESSWTQLWETVGIVPESRGAMEKWRDDFRDCAQQSVETRRLAAEIGGLDETIARHQTDLVSSLASVGKQPPDGMSLLGLLDHADQVAAVAAAARHEHTNLTKSCAEAEKLLRRHVAARAKAEEAMAGWRVDWVAAVMALGLGETASPNEATAILKALSEITSTGRELGDMQRRISGIERRNSTFTGGVATALAKLDGHGDLADASPDVAITTLARRLAAAQETAAEHRTTTEERESHEKTRIDADLRIAEANERISQMVVAAGVTDGAQLSEAIARSEEQAVLVARIAQLEDDLRKATGLTVSEVESEAAEMDSVEIEPEIDELVREIESTDETLKIQGKVVGELTNKRSLIGTSGEAADAMTRAQQSMTAVAMYGEEYVQVLLAKQLLEEQVAVYRDEHQGPLLSRARELFRKLTLDRYLGLDTDTDDKGNPYLLARTAADRLLDISALSTGTRDQLYLALRFAALEQFIDRRGPLPLVLDDLFVHFDDERTAAGLAVLDQVADQAQVLLFTHHEQVAKQAVDVIDADRLTVHHLG
jgi:uncharacterized protein YhaN